MNFFIAPILAFFLQLSPPPPSPCVEGDINLDGKIDGSDVAFVLAFWGTPFQRADLDKNGIVGGGDLGLLLLFWHDCLVGKT